MNSIETLSSHTSTPEFSVQASSSTPPLLQTPPCIQFEKLEYGNIVCFLCNDGGWQLNKDFGFHKISPSRDYHVQWVEKDGRWSLYITNYHHDYKNELTEIIITVDTIFDVIDYICKNKNIHY